MIGRSLKVEVCVFASALMLVVSGCRSSPSSESPATARATTQALSSWPAAGQWLALKRGGVVLGDPNGDTSGAPGSNRDVEGSELLPAAYVASDATQISFRLRLGAAPASGSDLASTSWGCLLDTDGRANTWEYLVAVNGSVAGDRVEFSRNTTQLVLDSAADPAEGSPLATYSALTDNVVGSTAAHARVVAAGTALGGGSDSFLDFAIDQADLQAAGVTAANAVRVLCGTSSTSLALDDDVVGSVTSMSAQLSDPVTLGLDGAVAYQALCPSGLACFYMPAMLPAPTMSPAGYAVLGGGDMVFASPTGAATVTYRYGAGPGSTSVSVAAGGKQVVQLTGGSNGFATGTGVAEQRGVFVTSTQHDLLAEQRYTPVYWQSSSTIKANTVALGTRFRVAGYSLNNSNSDGSGWDYLSFYAPYTTTITVAAPASAPTNIWNGSSRTVTVNLTAGQSYILKSIAGSAYTAAAGHGRAPEIDGTLVTSTAPISLVVGGMGWGYTPGGIGCAGDTGADGVVPVKYLGTQYVVNKFSATGEEDVRVVADTDGTQVSLNGSVVATLSAGQTHTFVPTGVTYIEATAPVAVFENTSYVNCEADIGFIPPIAFASLANVPSMTVAFNSKGPGTVMVVVPAAQKGTVKLDNSSAGAVESTVPGRADITTLKFGVTTGDHVVTATSDIQVMLVAQDPGGGTGYVGYYSPYRRPGVGNGVLDPNESCDDANVRDGDGCSSVGEVEAGFMCVDNGSGVSVCGCATDTACAAGQYCANGIPNSCQAQLAAGAALPAGHGTCAASGPLGGASTACATGLCNVTTNTCASGAGVACTTASQCTTNSCSSSACADTVVLGVTPGTTQYTGGGAAAPVDATVTVSGSATIDGAVMSFGSGFVAAEDRLTFSTQGTITGSYDDVRGTLTLSGAGTLAQYQSALRSVTYSNLSATPTAGVRVVSISLGTAVSNASSGHFYEYVAATLTWPEALSAAGARRYLGLKGYLATVTSGPENDFIFSKLSSDGWFGAQASSNSFSRTWGWADGPESGTQFCTNSSAGVCSSIAGAYSNWNTNEPNSAGGNEGCGQIYFAQAGRWNDLPCTVSTLGGYVVEYGGSAADPVLAIAGTRDVNVNYVATAVTTTGTTLSYTQGSSAAAVDPGVTVTGTDVISSATVAIVSGLVVAEDTLAFTSANGLSGSYDSGTGVLTVSGTGTTAAYQAALRTVTYHNGVAPRPTTALRSVRFTVGAAFSARALLVMSLPLVTVGSSANPSTYGQSVTFTATLTPAAATGTVEFFADGTSLGTASVVGGSASRPAPSLAMGTRAITASYSGDTQRLSASGGLSQVVQQLASGQGPCTVPNQAVVCASGQCNVTTGTCGSSNQGACTAANQCVSNICGNNSKCGLADGQSGCTVGTASLCQSGACSANAGSCIPVGGCAVTADCGAGQQCNGSLACEVAPGLATSVGITGYDALGASVAVDPQVTVVGANALNGATVTLGTGFVSGEDVLLFTNGNGISGAYDSSTGVLTLSGTASSAAYQTALRTVRYSNQAGASPTTALRTVTFGLGLAVANAANGHFYEYVASSGTWTQAKAAAEARTSLGLAGYLATITSAAENDFITAKLSSDGWFGAQADGVTFPRTWSWATGPEAGAAICTNNAAGSCSSVASAFANWNGGEPNSAGSNEACGQIYFAQGGRWNDLPCAGSDLPGYVVEYGGSAADPVLTLNGSKDLQVRAVTSMVVSSSQNPSALHQAVTFTAALTPATATGTVQFAIDGVDVGAPVALVGSEATSAALSNLAVGVHAVTVSFLGDSQHQSVSGTLLGGQQVDPLANGVGPCTGSNAATDCASGACSSAGTCGLGTNEGPCTPANAAVRCQSGTCSSGGACMPATVGACYVDADCLQTQYCERSSNTCVTRLGLGAPLPNDGLHTGTCSSSEAAAVCQSGACNAAVDTCSAADGAACSAAAQCTSNACSASGRCVPAASGSCWADGDCASGAYCNRAAWTCVALVSVGGPLPSDGLHDGQCSASLAQAVCASARCNAVTNTCADAIGGACAAPAQCEANICSGGFCGLSDGDPGCTAGTASLCQSGVCSTAGTCIDASPGACWVDGDCAANKYCDRVSARCVADAVAGVALPNDAVHDGVCTTGLAQAVCASGACNAVTNTCAGANTASCSAPAQCVANLCGNNQQCGRAAGEGPCSAGTAAVVCQSGACNASANGNTSACVPSASNCWVDGDCATGQFCARSTFTCTAKLAQAVALPTDGLHQSCPADATNAACLSGLCNAATGTCAAANGHVCAAASGCVTDVCGNNGQCGVADGEGGCTPATGGTLCQSGNCAASNVCTPGGGCWVDADCTGTQFCDQAAYTCTARLGPGEPIPADGLHDGQCTPASGAAACVSGVCNAVTDTCALANGESCAVAAQCVTDSCGTNGVCGLADGQAGCTAATAGLCQSAQCSVGGVCVPAVSGGCWVDLDCVAAQHCKRDTLSCVDDVAGGLPIPSDTLHDGVCSAPTAEAVCTTAACNAVTNTCASDNGTACTSAAQCVVDRCGSNGQCGLAVGEAGCTGANPNVCQSAACSAAGTCVPKDGCWVDADCAADRYCHRDTTTCRLKEPAGVAIPADGLHDGVCSVASAEATCASGECNPYTNTCGLMNGEVCTRTEECHSNICGQDLKCGQIDGASCVSAFDCRGACIEGRCTTADLSHPPACGCGATGGSGWALWVGLAALAAGARRRVRPARASRKASA